MFCMWLVKKVCYTLRLQGCFL